MTNTQRDIALRAIAQVRQSDPYEKAYAAGTHYGYALGILTMLEVPDMLRLIDLLSNAHSMAIRDSLARRKAA